MYQMQIRCETRGNILNEYMGAIGGDNPSMHPGDYENIDK